MIEIQNLKKSFGTTVACDIPTLAIHDGDLLGLVGNNGAGKTTLFRLMLDLLQADNGNVLLDGIDPSASEDWKQATAAHIDDSFLIDYLTPEEYFAFLAKLSGIPQREVDERLTTFEHFAGGEVLGQKNSSATSRQETSRRWASFPRSYASPNWSSSTNRLISSIPPARASLSVCSPTTTNRREPPSC